MPKDAARSETFRLRLVAAIFAMAAIVLGGGRSAKAGFLANSADMAASRALGATFAGLPNGSGQGGLLGLRIPTTFGVASAIYLDQYHVLTASHAVVGMDLSKIAITTGNNVLTDPAASSVSKVYLPENFSFLGLTHNQLDLAVIELTTPLLGGVSPTFATSIAPNSIVTGAGFGQFGAADLGSYRQLTGEASAFKSRASNYFGQPIPESMFFLAINSSSTPQLRGRGDTGDSGGLWVNEQGQLIGLSIAATLTDSSVGYTEVVNLTNSTVRSFINASLGTAAVPEPSSLALLGIGAVGLAGYGLRRRG